MMDDHEANIEGHKSCKFSDVSNVVSREIPRKWGYLNNPIFLEFLY